MEVKCPLSKLWHEHGPTTLLNTSEPLPPKHNTQQNLFRRLQSGHVRRSFRGPQIRRYSHFFWHFVTTADSSMHMHVCCGLCRTQGLDSQQWQMCSSCRTHRRWRKTQKL